MTIREPTIPADLESAELDHGFVDDAELVGMALTGDAVGIRVRAASVNDCRISTARLTSANVERVRMVDVEFVGCDVSGAIFIEPVFRRVAFRDCRLSGTAFELADFGDVTFTDCRMDTVGLSMARIERMHVERCDLTEASFRNATLDRCAILDSKLVGADLGGLRSTGLRLHGSVLSDLKNPDGLRGATIDSAQMIPLAVQFLDAAKIEVTEDDGPPRLI